jgi:integrase/recombinase XerD
MSSKKVLYDACPLGHAKLETTALYTRVAVSTIRDVESPLERLSLNLTKRPPPA